MTNRFRTRREATDKYIGKEIFEIKPIVLGGSPTDPANKVLLSRADHIQLVNYWNNYIADLNRSGRVQATQKNSLP